MALLRSISQWLAWRRAQRRMRRRWRDLKVILLLVLICLLFQLFSLGCGVIGYTLQRLGLLPEATPPTTLYPRAFSALVTIHWSGRVVPLTVPEATHMPC
jgi:hypothetical protein